MITYTTWNKNIFDNIYAEVDDYLIMVLLSPSLILFDILLLPFEIIALIIYKKIEGDK